METLVKKISVLLELLKSLSTLEKQSLSPKVPGLPTIKPPSLPKLAIRTQTAKIPGIAPESKKNPKKIAEQIKDGSMSTKTQKIMLKIDHNGQWSL